MLWPVVCKAAKFAAIARMPIDIRVELPMIQRPFTPVNAAGAAWC